VGGIFKIWERELFPRLQAKYDTLDLCLLEVGSEA
jgi:hypothetical protein